MKLTLNFDGDDMLSKIQRSPIEALIEVIQSEPYENKALFVVAELSTLHWKKSLVYGNSWKKHGEIISIFANISRKYDRIENVFDNIQATTDETLLDTVADLVIYSTKYLGWLAEHETNAFTDFLESRKLSVQDIKHFYGNTGVSALLTDLVLVALMRSQVFNNIEDYKDCHDWMVSAYGNVEKILLKEIVPTNHWAKIQSTLNLALAGMQFLVLAIDYDADQWTNLVQYIDKL